MSAARGGGGGRTKPNSLVACCSVPGIHPDPFLSRNLHGAGGSTDFGGICSGGHRGAQSGFWAGQEGGKAGSRGPGKLHTPPACQPQGLPASRSRKGAHLAALLLGSPGLCWRENGRLLWAVGLVVCVPMLGWAWECLLLSLNSILSSQNVCFSAVLTSPYPLLAPKPWTLGNKQ